jgi:hypothetical protein
MRRLGQHANYINCAALQIYYFFLPMVEPDILPMEALDYRNDLCSPETFVERQGPGAMDVVCAIPKAPGPGCFWNALGRNVLNELSLRVRTRLQVRVLDEHMHPQNRILYHMHTQET